MRALSVLAWLIAAALLAPFIVYATAQTVDGTAAYIVSSGSMAPAIPAGAVIVTRSVDPHNLTAGDVITFRRGSGAAPRLTTHRVVLVDEPENGRRFRVKGDANENVDPGWVEAEEVRGEVVLTLPYIGYILAWAGTTTGFILLVVVPAIVLIIAELYSIWQELRDRD